MIIGDCILCCILCWAELIWAQSAQGLAAMKVTEPLVKAKLKNKKSKLPYLPFGASNCSAAFATLDKEIIDISLLYIPDFWYIRISSDFWYIPTSSDFQRYAIHCCNSMPRCFTNSCLRVILGSPPLLLFRHQSPSQTSDQDFWQNQCNSWNTTRYKLALDSPKFFGRIDVTPETRCKLTGL